MYVTKNVPKYYYLKTKKKGNNVEKTIVCPRNWGKPSFGGVSSLFDGSDSNNNDNTTTTDVSNNNMKIRQAKASFGGVASMFGGVSGFMFMCFFLFF